MEENEMVEMLTNDINDVLNIGTVVLARGWAKFIATQLVKRGWRYERRL